uniref:Uncharacterized protein n=1 Tax=Arundo donax TaxID=35708 RepID=A0A0A9AEG4_ARUDO
MCYMGLFGTSSSSHEKKQSELLSNCRILQQLMSKQKLILHGSRSISYLSPASPTGRRSCANKG